MHIFFCISLVMTAVLGFMPPSNTFPIEIRINSGEEHMVWHKAMEEYTKSKKNLEEYAQSSEAYTTLNHGAFIKDWADYLGQFATGAPVIIHKNAQSSTTTLPPISGVPNVAQWYHHLMKLAYQNCNARGVKFLHTYCGVNLNTPTAEGRTMLHMLGEQQTDTTPADMVHRSVKLGFDTKQINTLDAAGQTLLHNAASSLYKNYLGFAHADYNFEKQIASGAIKLDPQASKEKELQQYRLVREDAMKKQVELIKTLQVYGARNTVKNSEGKQPSDIAKECAEKNPVCKEAYEALLLNNAALMPAQTAVAAAAVGTSVIGALLKSKPIIYTSKFVVAAACVSAACYLAKKAYDKIKQKSGPSK